MALKPRNSNAEFVISKVYQVPLCVFTIAVSLGNTRPIAQEIPVSGVQAALREIVASFEFYAVNNNFKTVKLCPDSIALFIVNLIVLNLLIAVIVSSGIGSPFSSSPT